MPHVNVIRTYLNILKTKIIYIIEGKKALISNFLFSAAAKNYWKFIAAW